MNVGQPMYWDPAHGSGAVRPSRTSRSIAIRRELAVQDGEATEPRIVSVRLGFDRLSDPATRQLPAFEARAGRWEELRWSLERIRHRFGEGRLWRATIERPKAALPEHRSRLVDIGQ